ncbi:MAG TPA: LysR family transcriptional regulator [Planctomycetota bacterium]|nr:LysR family transcriptional regulator [Planctomycetota bacterium]
MLAVRFKTWVESDGVAVFGDGRARLLEAIEATGSLTAAAKALGMPYRTAWKHVSHMERGVGTRLLERKAGGARGGGTRLTETGRRLLRGYRTFRRGLDKWVEARFRRFVRLA